MEMQKNSLRAFAPATVANVACGFDIFGFALHTPGDEVEVRLVPAAKDQVVITSISGDGGCLPYEVEKNCAGVSVRAFLDFLGVLDGVEIVLKKNMPLGSGLGSSAASAAAAVFAVNALLGSPLTARQLVPFAMEGERIACGAAHADNVAPALLGGFVLIRSYSPLDLISIPCNLSIFCTILHPHIEIRTEEARKILPTAVPLQQVVSQTGNATALIAALIQGDAALLSRALSDEIVEPLRAALIPGFYAIKEAALAAGALGCSISGSGPSLFALTIGQKSSSAVGAAMAAACRGLDIPYDLYFSAINSQGARLLL